MTGRRPRVSVVVPHRNDPAGLQRCLASLASQAAPPAHEIIVVDNGSRVPPIDVCRPYPLVRLLHELTRGPGPARSRGAEAAVGEVVAFLDADCVAAPDWLTTIIDHFDARADAQIVGGQVGIAAVDPQRLTAVEAFESVFGYRMRLYVERDGYAATCNMAVRRRTFRAVGPFRGIDVAEDVEWGRRAAAAGAIPAYLPAMRVATPARRSYADLARKWDRHVAHEYAEVTARRLRLRWLGRAVAVAASPVADLPRIATSTRLQGWRPRLLAAAVLIRIRMRRASRMVALVAGADPVRLRGGWGRPAGVRSVPSPAAERAR